MTLTGFSHFQLCTFSRCPQADVRLGIYKFNMQLLKSKYLARLLMYISIYVTGIQIILLYTLCIYFFKCNQPSTNHQPRINHPSITLACHCHVSASNRMDGSGTSEWRTCSWPSTPMPGRKPETAATLCAARHAQQAVNMNGLSIVLTPDEAKFHT